MFGLHTVDSFTKPAGPVGLANIEKVRGRLEEPNKKCRGQFIGHHQRLVNFPRTHARRPLVLVRPTTVPVRYDRASRDLLKRRLPGFSTPHHFSARYNKPHNKTKRASCATSRRLRREATVMMWRIIIASLNR